MAWNEEQPDEEDEAEDDFGHGGCVAARFAAVGRRVLKRWQRAGVPGSGAPVAGQAGDGRTLLRVAGADELDDREDQGDPSSDGDEDAGARKTASSTELPLGVTKGMTTALTMA